MLTLTLSIPVQNDKDQKTLFFSLTDKGIMKIIECFQSPNEKIRVLSFSFFIELIWNNEMIQNVLCEKYNFNPIGSIICVNFIPELFQRKISLTADIISSIKQSQLIPQKQTTKYWKWPDNPKYSDTLIPDPQRYLLGFYYCGNQIPYEDPEIEDKSTNIQQIIEVLEDGYEAMPLDVLGVKKREFNQPDKMDLNQLKSPIKTIKEDGKKMKKKTMTKSTDSVVSLGEKLSKKK